MPELVLRRWPWREVGDPAGLSGVDVTAPGDHADKEVEGEDLRMLLD